MLGSTMDFSQIKIVNGDLQAVEEELAEVNLDFSDVVLHDLHVLDLTFGLDDFIVELDLGDEDRDDLEGALGEGRIGLK